MPSSRAAWPSSRPACPPPMWRPWPRHAPSWPHSPERSSTSAPAAKPSLHPSHCQARRGKKPAGGEIPVRRRRCGAPPPRARQPPSTPPLLLCNTTPHHLTTPEPWSHPHSAHPHPTPPALPPVGAAALPHPSPTPATPHQFSNASLTPPASFVFPCLQPLPRRRFHAAAPILPCPCLSWFFPFIPHPLAPKALLFQ